jgi:hypothetical protein
MDFMPLHIAASEKQRSRLRNGHRVRVSPAMEGCGFNLIVNPATFDTASKCFRAGRGTMVQLSPMEIQANRGVEGEGIFGKQFDRFVKKTIGKKATKDLYKVAEKVGKPLVKKGLDAAALAATTFAPSAAPAIQAAKRAAQGYISRPTAYQENPSAELMKDVNPAGMAEDYIGGLMAGEGVFDMVKKAAKSKIGKQLQKKALSMAVKEAKKAGVPSIVADLASKEASSAIDGQGVFDMVKKAAKSKIGKQLQKKALSMAVKEAKKAGVPSFVADLASKEASSAIDGQGLYASSASRGRGVMGRGAIMGCGYLPPALQSQNNSANFMFHTQLPPSLAMLKRYGVMEGQGLYA